MAHQEEPLYDFPEPTPLLVQKCLGHQRSRSSLKSINVLDRLLLTVPVWLQLSINPATALHILQREPPGTFLVRKSRTSKKNVLCVRLADDSMPSFVQQFGIREENSTLSLETSAISFLDLPRLISFYCVSRDILPFPLELPEAIAKASSHKELESISHMGIEFWNSHLNIRGPREVPKPQKDEHEQQQQQPDAVASVLHAAPDSAVQPHSGNQPRTVPESDTGHNQAASSPTVFQTFCPITTRSPKELDCGSGLGDLCFINPLFLQSQDPTSRRRMFQRRVKVRVSTETETLLSPPIAPPPPPPLMPKSKRKCKAQKAGEGSKELGISPCQATQSDPFAQDTQPKLLTQTQHSSQEAEFHPSPTTTHFWPELEEQGREEKGMMELRVETEHLPDDSEYKQPSPVISSSHSPLLSPYSCLSSTPPLLFHKQSPSLSPYHSPSISPSPSPRAPFFRSPHDSASASPSLSPHQSPPLSRKASFSLSPFTSPSFAHLIKEPCCTPDTHPSPVQQSLESESEQQAGRADELKDEDTEPNKEQEKTKDEHLVLHMKASCNSTLCKSITQCN